MGVCNSCQEDPANDTSQHVLSDRDGGGSSVTESAVESESPDDSPGEKRVSRSIPASWLPSPSPSIDPPTWSDADSDGDPEESCLNSIDTGGYGFTMNVRPTASLKTQREHEMFDSVTDDSNTTSNISVDQTHIRVNRKPLEVKVKRAPAARRKIDRPIDWAEADPDKWSYLEIPYTGAMAYQMAPELEEA